MIFIKKTLKNNWLLDIYRETVRYEHFIGVKNLIISIKTSYFICLKKNYIMFK